MPGVERVIDLGTGIAVVAATTWHAFRGAEAAAVEWGPAPYPDTTAAIFDRIAEAFDDAPNSTLRDDGTVPAPAADDILAEYRVPFLAHATMEPMNATALRTEAGLELWCGSQAPVMTRDRCAEAVGLDPEAVTVNTT
ncbi:MAG: molybdopterin-dependent oxidoreductase, partial [Rhodobacteraceae bacterium]|nr:molybdopterin-dependent oxidoreductase [Paracoccaceae bacterium]